ncbi:MAG: hypothetical protein ACI8Y4_002412 [Candidatus Poriferisodalaceae bacterium]|jgi:hypothetical protein
MDQDSFEMSIENRLRDHLQTSAAQADLMPGSLNGVQRRGRDRARRHRVVAGSAMASVVAVAAGVSVFALRAGNLGGENFALGVVTTLPSISLASTPSPTDADTTQPVVDPTSATQPAGAQVVPPATGRPVTDTTSTAGAVALVAETDRDGSGVLWRSLALPTAPASRSPAITVDRYASDGNSSLAFLAGEWFVSGGAKWRQVSTIDALSEGEQIVSVVASSGAVALVVAAEADVCGDSQSLAWETTDGWQNESLPMRSLGRVTSFAAETKVAASGDLVVAAAAVNHHFDPACLASGLDLAVPNGAFVELVDSQLVITDPAGDVIKVDLTDFELGSDAIAAIAADPVAETVLLVRPVGEQRWRIQRTSAGSIGAVTIQNGQPLVVVDDAIAVLRLDADFTWSTMSTPIEAADAFGAASGPHGVLFWSDTAIYMSRDLGVSWINVDLPKAVRPEAASATATGLMVVGQRPVDGAESIAVVAVHDGSGWGETPLVDLVGLPNGVVDVVAGIDDGFELVLQTPDGLVVFGSS